MLVREQDLHEEQQIVPFKLNQTECNYILLL